MELAGKGIQTGLFLNDNICRFIDNMSGDRENIDPEDYKSKNVFIAE